MHLFLDREKPFIMFCMHRAFSTYRGCIYIIMFLIIRVITYEKTTRWTEDSADHY